MIGLWMTIGVWVEGIEERILWGGMLRPNQHGEVWLPDWLCHLFDWWDGLWYAVYEKLDAADRAKIRE